MMRWNSNDDTLPKTNFYGFSSCLLYIHCATFDYYFIETGLLAYIFDLSRSTTFNMLLLQKYIYILHDFHLDHVRLFTTLSRFVHVFQYLFSYKSTASGPGNNPTMIQPSQEPKHHYLISCHLATRRFVIESGLWRFKGYFKQSVTVVQVQFATLQRRNAFRCYI